MNESLPKPKKSWLIRLLNPFVAIPITLLFLLLCAPFVYRGYKLSLVPDPGEPFDVASFIKASYLNDAGNALIDFQSAVALSDEVPYPPDSDLIYQELYSGKNFSAETEKVIKFLESNMPALQAWKKGTEQEEFCEIPADEISIDSLIPMVDAAHRFVFLFIAQAQIEIRAGNSDEAANWYLAAFHTARLIQKHGGIIHHLVSCRLHARTTNDLISKIQNPHFSTETLKKLLHELNEIQNSFSQNSDILKWEHLAFLNFMNSDPKDIVSDTKTDATVPEILLPFWFYVVAEPDLSIRVSRQWLGNVLPEVDRPRYQRSRFSSGVCPLFLYHSSLKATHNKRQLTPSEICHLWDDSCSPLSVYYTWTISHWIDAADKFQIQQCLLMTALRLEIFRREHGSYPLTLKEVFPNGKVSTDIFGSLGAPIQYAIDSENTCRIWSVGFDGINDAGINLGFGEENNDYGYQLDMKRGEQLND